MAARDYTVRVRGDLSQFNSEMDAAGAKMEALNDNEVIVSLDIADGDEAKVRNAIQAMINMDPSLNIQLTYELDQRRLEQAKAKLKELQDLADIFNGVNSSGSAEEYIRKEINSIEDAFEKGATIKSMKERVGNIFQFAASYREKMGKDLPEDITKMLEKLGSSHGNTIEGIYDNFLNGKIKTNFGEKLSGEIQQAVNTIKVFENELKVLENRGAKGFFEGAFKGAEESIRTFERLASITKTLGEMEVPNVLLDARTDEDKAAALLRLAKAFNVVDDAIENIREESDPNGEGILSSDAEDQIGILTNLQSKIVDEFQRGFKGVNSDWLKKYIPNFEDYDIFSALTQSTFPDIKREASNFRKMIGKFYNDALLHDKDDGFLSEELVNLMIGGSKNKYKNLLDDELSDINKEIDDALKGNTSDRQQKQSDQMDEDTEKTEENTQAHRENNEERSRAPESDGGTSEETEKDTDATEENTEAHRENREERERDSESSGQQQEDTASTRDNTNATNENTDAKKNNEEASRAQAEADCDAADAAKQKADAEKEANANADNAARQATEESGRPLSEEAQRFEDIASAAKNAASAKMEFALANQVVADVAREAAEELKKEKDAMDSVSDAASKGANEKGKTKTGSRKSGSGRRKDESSEEIRNRLYGQVGGLYKMVSTDYGLNAQHSERIADVVRWIELAGDDIEKLEEVQVHINHIFNDISTRHYDSTAQPKFTEQYDALKDQFIGISDYVSESAELEHVFGDRIDKIREQFNNVRTISGFDSLKKAMTSLNDDIKSYEWPSDFNQRKQQVLVDFSKTAKEVFDTPELMSELGDGANAILDSFDSVKDYKGLVALRKKINTYKKDLLKQKQLIDDREHDPELNDRFLKDVEDTENLGHQIYSPENDDLYSSFGEAYERLIARMRKVKETNDSVELYEGQLRSLQSRVTSGLGRKDAMRKSVQDIKKQLSENPALQSEFGERLGEIEERVENVSLLAEPLGKTENVINTLKKNIDNKGGLANKKMDLRKTLSDIGKKISDNPEAVSDFEEAQRLLESRWETTSLRINDLDRLASVIDTHNNRINKQIDLYNKKSQMQSKFTELEGKIASDPQLAYRLGDLVASTKKDISKLGTSEGDVAKLTQSVEVLEAAFKSASTNIKSDTNGIESSIKSLSTNKDSYFKSLNDYLKTGDENKLRKAERYTDAYTTTQNDIRNYTNGYGEQYDIAKAEREYAKSMSESARRELTNAIEEESQRLSSYRGKNLNVAGIIGGKNMQDRLDAISEDVANTVDFDPVSITSFFKRIAEMKREIDSAFSVIGDNEYVDKDKAVALSNQIKDTISKNVNMSDETKGGLLEILSSLDAVIKKADEAKASFVELTSVRFDEMSGSVKDFIDKEEALLKSTDSEKRTSQHNKRMERAFSSGIVNDIKSEFGDLEKNRQRFFESLLSDEDVDSSFVEKYIQKIEELKHQVELVKIAFGETSQEAMSAEKISNNFADRLMSDARTNILNRANKYDKILSNTERRNEEKGIEFDTDATAKLNEAKDILKDIINTTKQMDPSLGIDVDKIKQAELALDSVGNTLDENINKQHQFIKKSKADSLLGKVNDILNTKAVSGDVKQIFLDIQAALQGASKEAEQLGLDFVKISETDFSKIVGQFNEGTAKMKASGMDQPKFISSFRNAITNQSAQFLATYFSLQDFVRYGKEIAQTVTSLDSAMVELRKVSGETDQRLDLSFKNSAETAKELGAEITSVINSTADWSRLGYSIDEAEELARVTQIYQNVGDNLTQDTASEYLVSTLQGFHIDSEEALRVVDSINAVANNYAVDTQMIGESLERSAASFSASGTDLNKSIALVSATAEVTQDAASAGTVWKTDFCFGVQKCASRTHLKPVMPKALLLQCG